MTTAHRIPPASAAALAFLLFSGSTARAQNTPEVRAILERLDRLEKDNQNLMEEVRGLRRELANARPAPPAPAPAESPSPPAGESASTTQSTPVDDRLAVQQSRIDELAQTKVESSQKFPVRLTGMVLFNGFLNGRSNGSNDNPLTASMGPGSDKGGGTLRQSIIGLEFDGPQTFGGGKISGTLSMDLFGGSAASLGHTLRLRTATLKIDWKNTTVSVGQDKPIISPRDPDSLAQVGFSPLTGAGNLWLWQPQLRLEQRIPMGENDGLRFQVGAFQTSAPSVTAGPYDPYNEVPAGTSEASTPGVEGRLEYWRRWSETGRLEIAGGVHVNRNHFGPYAVPTNAYSVDWLFRPGRLLEFTGMFYHGRNVATLGALPQGFVIFPNGDAVSVESTGGWAQIKLPITSRLAFNIYGGQQDDRHSDLLPNMIGKNQGYFSNVMYRLAPNVIVSLEGGQIRTTYLGLGNRLNDHYDLALGYLF